MWRTYECGVCVPNGLAKVWWVAHRWGVLEAYKEAQGLLDSCNFKRVVNNLSSVWANLCFPSALLLLLCTATAQLLGIYRIHSEAQIPYPKHKHRYR